MVVDDDRDILSVITRILENTGIEVHDFDNPISALQHVVEDGCGDCWLLLSDARMPGMSGFEFVQKVRELRPELVILLMSSIEMQMSEFEKLLPATRIDGFVSKPTKMSELVKTIKQHESIRMKS